MKKIPTAKEFITSYNKKLKVGTEGSHYTLNINSEGALIEFAKKHTKAALKAAFENSKIDKDSILKAYSLDNIK